MVVFFNMTVETTRPKDGLSERWTQTRILHSRFSGFLERRGQLIPAQKLLNGHGFESYVHKSLWFPVQTQEGEEINIILLACEPPKDHSIIVNLSNREESILLLPSESYEREPPSIKDLELMEHLYQQMKRVLFRRSKKQRHIAGQVRLNR